MNYQLFLRASPRNRAEIKRVLAVIDRPTRQLMIRVSQNREADQNSRAAAASGQVMLGSTKRAQGSATVWETGGTRRDSAGQMVRTVEGGRAFIQVGRSLPVPMRQIIVGPGGVVINEMTIYQDIGQGFYAAPDSMVIVSRLTSASRRIARASVGRSIRSACRLRSPGDWVNGLNWAAQGVKKRLIKAVL